MKSNKNEIKMNSRILKLTIPNIISNISVPLLGMVDLAIAGNLGDKSYLGAIAISTTIFTFVYWGFGFLRMGTTGFTAQAYGARQLSECMKIFTRAAIIAIIVSYLILLFKNSIFSASNYLLNTPDSIFHLVKEYFYVRVWAAPATLLLYVYKGWFIGLQNSKVPMWVSIGINIVNIVFSLLLVTVWDLGITGIALGTVIAQYFGLILFIVITNKYYSKLYKYFDFKGSFNPSEMILFFKVNSNIFIRTVCLIIVFTFFTSASAKMGETTLAVNTLFMQLFTLFSYIMDGFAYAGESLIGKYYGSNNIRLLKSCTNKLILWGCVFGAIFTLGYALFLEPILSIFTEDQTVISQSRNYIGWIVAVPFSGFLAFLFDGVLIGMTKTRVMRDIIIVSVVWYFIVYYSLQELMGNSALWFGFIMFLLFRGVLQMFAYRRIVKNM